MKIIVCVKQVPGTTEVKTDPETGRLIRSGIAAIINPFDQYALEEAIRIKEKNGGTITALSMGPPQAQYALKNAIAMGSDSGYLLSDRAFAGADTLATIYTLSQGIKKIGMPDLIICGIKTTDGDTAQVGPGIAEELDLPHVCYVRKIREISEKKMVLEQAVDDGTRLIEVSLPCVITVVREINVPRMPTLSSKIESLGKEITIYTKADLGGEDIKYGADGSPTQVKKVFEPEIKPEGMILKGSPEEVAKQLIKELESVKAWEGK